MPPSRVLYANDPPPGATFVTNASCDELVEVSKAPGVVGNGLALASVDPVTYAPPSAPTAIERP